MSLKKISLTKKEIIDAINTEPLGAREAFATAAPNAKTCKVCAVGAVVRYAGRNRSSLKSLLRQTEQDFIFNCDWNAGNACNELSSVENIITEDQVQALQNKAGGMSALSSYYEYLKRAGYRLPKIRTTLTNYVQNHFPARTKITVSL